MRPNGSLVGQIFNKWKVIEIGEPTVYKRKVGQAIYTVVKVRYVCECLGCGRHLLVLEESLKSGKSKQCRSCSLKESHPVRIAGRERKPLGDLVCPRTRPEYLAWRLAVFTRDGFTCVCCGDSRGGNLNAHHIMAFTRFPEYSILEINGVTLCETCHKEFHKLHGSRNNTLSQFLDYQQQKGFQL